jgi:phosphoserine phosphatase RsbU/P
VRSSEEYEQTEFTLEAGDRVLAYTDGLVEAVNARGEAFGEAELADFIATHQDLAAEQFAERLLDKVLGWPENGSARAQADDMTVVVIDIGNMPEQTS